MSDTIKRTECSKCGWGRGDAPPIPKPSSCGGPLVERTYVAVGDFADRVIDEMAEADGEVKPLMGGTHPRRHRRRHRGAGMILHTIWGFDRYEDAWSMLDCWSDGNVDENREGYDDALKKFRTDDLLTDVRVINVKLAMADVEKALKTPVILAAAASGSRDADAPAERRKNLERARARKAKKVARKGTPTYGGEQR